jgi:hypothetical protein
MNSKGNTNNKNSRKLRNYSQVYSMNRLSDPDNQKVSGLTAGGDKEYLEKDINDSSESKR